jgi:hypothetical protein
LSFLAKSVYFAGALLILHINRQGLNIDMMENIVTSITKLKVLLQTYQMTGSDLQHP